MGKSTKYTVGVNSCELKRIPKPLIKLVVSLQRELQDKENNTNKYKPRKISFVYASLELTRRFNK